MHLTTQSIFNRPSLAVCSSVASRESPLKAGAGLHKRSSISPLHSVTHRQGTGHGRCFRQARKRRWERRSLCTTQKKRRQTKTKRSHHGNGGAGNAEIVLTYIKTATARSQPYTMAQNSFVPIKIEKIRVKNQIKLEGILADEALLIHL